ncbi:MAG: hypothetical protein K2P63_11565 [Lachnospiraceae bacterium]|nr:hypothetical protein [Lachnospiraceae bacterium]
MEYLAAEVRRLVYTVICFQCFIQLAEGSVYQKYLKLFSYLLTMCICCNVIFSFLGQVETSFVEADQLYTRWEKEWREITQADQIYEGSAYYEHLWEDKIIGEAQDEYDIRNGGDASAGEDTRQDSAVAQ